MKETKQKENHLIRMVALLALLLVGVNVSWGQKLPTASVTLSGGAGTPFALVNTSAGKAIYGSGDQNLAYDVYSTAFTDASTGYCFVLEKPTNGTYDDNDYLLKFLTKYNEDYTYGGNTSCYLNSTSYGLAFVLGLTGNNHYTYGQDMDNGAVWTITQDGDGIYKLKNKATGKYLAGNNSNDTGDNWSFCTVGDGCKVEFSANDGSMGSVTATVNGNTINSGDYVAYGTQVKLTANPKAGYAFQNWSNGTTAPTRTWTVTEDGHPTATFAVGYTVNVNLTNLPENCDAWFTIGSDPTKYKTAQTVAVGTQIVYTMTSSNPHHSPNGWRTAAWQSGEDWGWMGDGATFTTTVRSASAGTDTHEHNLFGDLNPWPEYTNNFLVYALAEEGGTATVSDASGHDMNTGYNCSEWAPNKGETGSLTFTATANPGYVFEGWYNTSGTRVSPDATWPYGVYSSVNTAVDLTITARFTVVPALKTIGKPFCNHAPGKENGDNYFDINQLNPAEGVTLGEWNSDTGRTVTVPTTGGYMSYVFDAEYNLGDLVSWQISDVAGLQARVNSVEFLEADGTQLVNCYTDAGNRTNVDLSVQSKLKNVKEIRIHFKESNEEHRYETSLDYTFKWIRFTFEHSDRTRPTLTDGTTSEMEIYETTSLSITNTPGYWRQYTDGNYNVVKKKTEGGLIDETKEWTTHYKFDNMALGDYYFGARDGGPCALGYTHETELVKVHVNVKALDLTGAKSTDTTDEQSFVGIKDCGGYVNLSYPIHVTVDDKTVDATVKFNNIRYDFRDDESRPTDISTIDGDCNGVILFRDKQLESLPEANEVRVTPPNGYRIQKVTFNFGEESYYNLSFNNGSAVPKGTANSVTWVNTSTDKDYVRMVIRAAADQEKDDDKCTELHIISVQAWLVPVNAKVIDESRTVAVSDTENRDYWLYVPEKVKNGTNKEVSVVFALHGGGEDYEPTHSGQLNFNSLADQYNFVVVYPRAKEHLFPHFNPNPARAWLATGGKNEDTEYFEAILNAIEHNTDGYTINTDKVYMAGFSVGGMMAYATANVLPGKFAAFASLAGFPMNETHLRHHGDKPVPFLHVHGTKDDFVNYKYMPTIVDNMVARNGLSYTPTSVIEGDADIWGETNKTRYTKSVYGSGSTTPFVYYEVGTGMTASDTGLGHTYWCALDGVDVKKVMWDFLSQFALTDSRNTDIEFAPQIDGMAPGVHNGWRVKENNNLLQYGETGGYSTATQNVYHSLQLKKADHHYLNFTLSGNTTDNVNVRLYKIGSIAPFNDLNTSFSSDPQEVLNLNYKAGQSITIDFKTDEDGEYQLLIAKESKWADINVTDLSITKTGSPKGEISDKPVSTDFGGYYNYNQRLFAQWNFDLCDGFRFNVKKIKSTHWDVKYTNTDTGDENVKNGTVIYTYKPAITPSSKNDYEHYEELTYDGSEKIPALAGLKFMAAANSIEMYVDYQNGIINGTHLVVNKNVKMIVPYVENSYRNDKGNTESPEDNVNDFKNCMHHIKRDILYIALHEGSIWDGKHVISSECIDDVDAEHKTALFHNGGDEFVNGHSYNKGDYLGRPGTPCVLQFNGTTVFDRIGVNRNLTFSFYTEYISEYGVPKPTPRMRVIGSPTGLKVANVSQSGATYEGAIAMTFGGWNNTEGSNCYEAFNQGQNKADHVITDAIVTDVWSDLGVCIGDYPGKSKTFMTWAEASDYPVIESVKTPMAADGFPVTSVSYQLAKSESLMPETTTGNKYHEACEGDFAASYKENYTPWTLPCRGAYVKFEPTLPGVLNVDVLQKNNKIYYLVDEFGKPVENVFTKTATNGSTNASIGNGQYKVTGTKDDYVKYSFNVYPGKTYYIFSNEHGMGLTGFYFEPYVYKYAAGSVPAGKTEEYARMDVGVKTLENDAPYVFNDENTTGAHLPEGFACGDTQISIKSPGTDGDVLYPIHYSEKAVKVRMNRAFKAGEWTSICFPFSLNQNMMEQIFGKGTKVILLRDIQNRTLDSNYHTVANFIMHENQDILAGYPYLICPVDQIASGFTTTVCLYPTAPETPSISGIGFKTNIGSGDFGGDGDYVFQGSFAVQDVKKGSYLTSGGKLARAASAGKIKAYRAFMQYNGSEENMLAKAITMFNLGDFDDDEYGQPTFIDGVQVDNYGTDRNVKNDNNVYNMQGQIVRSAARSLVGLSKGAYIVNGKKHIVK